MLYREYLLINIIFYMHERNKLRLYLKRWWILQQLKFNKNLINDYLKVISDYVDYVELVLDF